MDISFILEYIKQFIVAYPNATAIFAAIGFLRMINKPLFIILRAYVQSTPSKTDDVELDKVEQSQAYKYFVFALDYLASVKLDQQAPPAESKKQEDQKPQ